MEEYEILFVEKQISIGAWNFIKSISVSVNALKILKA